MGNASFRSVASARALVSVTVGVMVAFVATTAISQLVESQSARDVDDIVGNAMPSVQALSMLRGDLYEMQDVVSRRAEIDAAKLARELANQRRDVEADLATYRRLPFFEGEGVLFAPVPALVGQLDVELSQPVATRADADAISDTLDRLDDAAERLETFDAAQGQRLGLAIARARSESRAIVWVLDAVCVMLALGAVALAVRQRRRAIHAIADETERSLSDLRSQVDELGHFAGRVAHDIRNPLNTAVLSLEVVRATCPTPSSEAAIDRALKAMHRVEVLVGGLLDFARAGGKPAADAACSMPAVIDEIVEGLAAEASAANIALHAAVPAQARAACSDGVLASIVANLARNAIHHMGDAAEREIELRVAARGPQWRLEVQDTGPGVPPGEEKRIFEPYIQLDHAGGSIGLGLATVERLARAHGGSVGVVSSPGRGALFWVELPAVATS